jgi:hypothetical protein
MFWWHLGQVLGIALSSKAFGGSIVRQFLSEPNGRTVERLSLVR